MASYMSDLPYTWLQTENSLEQSTQPGLQTSGLGLFLQGKALRSMASFIGHACILPNGCSAQ